MAPTTKAKSKAISASSFLELKAELAKKEEEISKLKAAGKSTTIAGGPKRPDKKPTPLTNQHLSPLALS
ncbi:hypothetical protein AX14_004495 [Amanita brunnescens Koide BX004]|nr:hypothetical protein AX14_004495 [Amanita brunnescens Koide BX004]